MRFNEKALLYEIDHGRKHLRNLQERAFSEPAWERAFTELARESIFGTCMGESIFEIGSYIEDWKEYGILQRKKHRLTAQANTLLLRPSSSAIRYGSILLEV